MRPNTFLTLTSLATAWSKPMQGPSKTTAASIGSNNTINLSLTDWIKNNHTDLQWYTTIAVGTPPRNFSVLIDTGSTGLLLPQANCTSCSLHQTKFNPADSSTFSFSPRGTASLDFSTGGDTIPLSSVQGAECNWAFDEVSFPTAGSGPSISFEFLLCHQEDEALTSQPGIDGILGLGINGTDPASLPWTMLAAGVLQSGVYGLHLHSGDDGAGQGGQLTLGGVDKSRFQGDALTWISLNETLATSHQQWVMDMQTIYINGEQLVIDPNARSSYSAGNSNSTENEKGRMVVPYPRSIVQVLDSGSSSLMAPSFAVAEALYAQISPEIYQIDPIGTWGAPCAIMDSIAADITFAIGSAGKQVLNMTIPSRAFNLGAYNSTLTDICQAVVNNWADMLSYDGMGLWELGSPLLKNYYTAWDGAELRVGFAPLAPSKGNMLSGSPPLHESGAGTSC